MKASIITIGDELLIGQTVDTNSAWIGAELSALGFDVCRITSIHDRKDDILEALGEAARISDLAIITGGLGPTSDDITKQTLCEYFGTRLVPDERVLGMIEAMLQRRKMPLNDNNRRQADVPENCTVLTNAAGTAPGMWFERKGKVFISLPGVPGEMRHIMNMHVLPELTKRFRSQVIIHRNIMTYGTYEAKLAELLQDFENELPAAVKLAYLPSYGVIKLRLTGSGKDRNVLGDEIEKQVRKLYKTIPEYIYAENEETLEIVIGNMLKGRNMTVATAESCTGGEVSHLITSVPGSSAYFRGGVVAYDNAVKTGVLEVSEESILKHGAVSREVSEEMAKGARRILNADFAVAVTGIAGPEGGTENKPVGTVWIAVSSQEGTVAEMRVFGTDRLSNTRRSSLAALNLLRLQLIRR
ncbi:MAG: competence/damage-inducible protein A [Bacteroidales bacterium]|jgi:nicotinamide-nucleotide amidase|nr:competence/damage-inducible protein A [Bacteroidales bacterium]